MYLYQGRGICVLMSMCVSWVRGEGGAGGYGREVGWDVLGGGGGGSRVLSAVEGAFIRPLSGCNKSNAPWERT